MKLALWVGSSLLVFPFGLWLARCEEIRQLDRPARFAVITAGGMVTLGVVMFALSAAGLRWTLLWLGLAALLCAITAIPALRRRHEARAIALLPLAPLAVITILSLYGAATARQTTSDLLLFWGPKGQRFFHSRSIDIPFLDFPHHYLMHPDYPPLQPLLYAWSSMIAGYFSWWGAILLTPLYLLLAGLIFRGFAAPLLGEWRAGLYAGLLAALLAFGITAARAAGGGDALLLLFEVGAMTAAAFGRGRGAGIFTAVCLAGAVFTKVEGALFLAAFLAASVLTRRRIRPLLQAVPAAVLLALWIQFARHHQLLDSYARGGSKMYLDRLGYVLFMTGWQASYRAFWLPWIAALAPMLAANAPRKGMLPLLIGLACIGYSVYFYLHTPDPLFWIRTSAERVLLTAVAAFAVASAAASE